MIWLITVKVTVVFLLAWLALSFMRRQSAALRHTVILAALVAGLLVPVLGGVLPSWRVLPNPEIPVVQETVRHSKEPTPPAVLSMPRAAASVMPAPAGMSALQWLVALWITGVAIQLSLLLFRILAMERAARRSAPMEDRAWRELVDDTRARFAIRQNVALRIRGEGTMPAIWGIRRPVVLLPADCTDWAETRRRDVLAHELAHIARRDLLFLILANVVCALHWFNPLSWILKRQLALESEHACDDMALANGAPASRYADHLLTTAARYRKRRSLAPVMAARSLLEGRIMAILDRDRSRGSASPLAVFFVVAVAAALLVPLSSLTWANADDRWAGTTVHDHDHEHVHSDSAQFAAHLDELGIDRTDVDALLANLNSTEALTRAASAWALGDIEEPRVVDPLIRAGYDSSALVRQWAVRSLAPWVEPRVATMLVDRLRDGDAETRQWAVRSLARHDAAVITQPLIDTLADSDDEVREWVVRALAKIDEPQVEAALAERMALETDNDVREWIVRSLDGGGSAQGTDALINALYSESADVRQWAVRGLSESRDDRAVDALITMLQDNDAEVREWSVRALGVCGNDRAVAPLQAMSADPSSDVREWAGRALKKIDC